MKTLSIIIALFTAFVLSAGFATAQTKEELRERFKQRDSQLQKYKQEGKLGETWDGNVAARPNHAAEADLKAFIAAENADRQKLYALLAKEQSEKTGQPVTAASVAIVNAERNFSKAKPNDWLLVAADRWVQKKDHRK